MGIQFGPLLEAKTTTGTGPTAGPNQSNKLKTFHAQIVGSGAIGATVLIQASNISSSAVAGYWVTLATIVVSGTSVISDGFVSEAPWKYYRANIFAISGTSATADVVVGDG